MNFHLAISSWLLLFPYFAYSQSVSDTVHIQEVEVIAPVLPERIALKITRPDSMAVASGITSSLSELLMQHSPVFIKSYGGGSQATASFRGTAPSHTQVIWNGMVLNSSSLGYADLSLLPLFFVDDVYLLHGGSSLVKGSGALGGSIHLDNLPAWKHGASLSGMVEFGSFGTEKYLGKFEAGNKKISSVIRLLYDASDNDFPYYNVGVFPYRQDTLKNGGYQRGAILQEFYWRPDEDYTVALRTWLQEGKRDLPPLMSYEGNPRVEYQKDQQARVQLELKKYRENGQFTISSGLNFTGNEYFRKTTKPDYVMDDAINREKSWFNRVELSQRLNPKVTFSGNLEMNYHAMKVVNRAKVKNLIHDRLESGILLHLIYQPSVRTGLYLLSRTEYYDSRFIPLIPSAGIEWKASERYPVWLKADITRNFHKPGLNDLYWIPGGNEELKPEKGITGEISLTTHMKRKSALIKQEVTLFVSEIKDWISWQPASNGASYWEASNLKEVLSRGVEYDFSGSSSWRKWKFNVSGNYALTLTSNLQSVSSVDKSRGKQLIYIPKHIGNIHGSVTNNNWTFLTDIGYTGKRYTQSSNESTWYESVLNPFWIASISMQKSVRFSKTELDARFKVDNLLDAGYQQILWRPMPGRHYSLTLAAKWGK